MKNLQIQKGSKTYLPTLLFLPNSLFLFFLFPFKMQLYYHLPSTPLCVYSLPPHFIVFIILRRKREEKKTQEREGSV